MLYDLPPQPPQKPIIIWIHGTQTSAFLPIQLTSKIKHKVNTVAKVPTGLQQANSLDSRNRFVRLSNALSKTDEHFFPFDTSYCFGWCGNLHKNARRNAAHTLYQSLKQLMQHYTRNGGCAPPITIITHSHGGNVALYLADFIQKEDEIIIDRLVLLACPVQEHTKNNIRCPYFKKIYSIHSHWDMIQIADPQGLHHWQDILRAFLKNGSLRELWSGFINYKKTPSISERHFENLPNLKQINVIWHNITPWNKEDRDLFDTLESLLLEMNKSSQLKKRGVLHTEFIIPSFIHQLPYIIQQADLQNPTQHGDITINL